MNLFELNDNRIMFSPQALALAPFKKLWTKDKTKNKTKALDSLYYVWYMTDLTSPYQVIRDESKREEEIIKDLNLKSFKADKDIKDAITFYRDRSKSMIGSLYESALIALDVVQSTFKDTKAIINESDNKLKDITAIIGATKQIPSIMKELRNAESELIKEQKEKMNNDSNFFEESFDQLL